MADVVLFDFADQSINFWDPGVKFAVVSVVAAIVHLIFRRVPMEERDERAAVLIPGYAVISLLSLLAGIVVVVHTWKDDQYLDDSYSKVGYRTVTGTVSDLKPGYADGHPYDEEFKVSDLRFWYEPHQVTRAFHRTVGNGGPMREGMHVRIDYADERILRITQIPDSARR